MGEASIDNWVKVLRRRASLLQLDPSETVLRRCLVTVGVNQTLFESGEEEGKKRKTYKVENRGTHLQVPYLHLVPRREAEMIEKYHAQKSPSRDSAAKQ